MKPTRLLTLSPSSTHVTLSFSVSALGYITQIVNVRPALPALFRVLMASFVSRKRISMIGRINAGEIRCISKAPIVCPNLKPF